MLGTSVDAVRKRIARGTLEYEKADGKVYVWLDDGAPRSDTDALISSKDETIAVLREQLEAERQAHAEARRIIAGLVERIPAIEAPQEARESPETVEEEQERAEPRSAAGEAQGGTDRSQRRRGWLAPVDKLPLWQYALGVFVVILTLASVAPLHDAIVRTPWFPESGDNFFFFSVFAVAWLVPGIFGLWVGFKHRNFDFLRKVVPMGLIIGIVGGLAAGLGAWYSEYTIYGRLGVAWDQILAVGVFMSLIGQISYVSGAFIGKAWQRIAVGTRLSSNTFWTPGRQAMLGFAGAIISAIITVAGAAALGE